MWLALWGFEALAEPSSVGADTIVTVHLHAPLPAAVSARITPKGGLGGDRARLGVEVWGGAYVLTRAWGIGPRLVLNVAQDPRRNDALIVTPGLDVMFLPMDPTYGAWFSGQYTDSTFLGGSAELGWTHQFRPRLGFDLGLRGGLVVGVQGYSSPRDSVRGEIGSQIGLFTGLRF